MLLMNDSLPLMFRPTGNTSNRLAPPIRCNPSNRSRKRLAEFVLIGRFVVEVSGELAIDKYRKCKVIQKLYSFRPSKHVGFSIDAKPGGGSQRVLYHPFAEGLKSGHKCIYIAIICSLR